MKRLRLLEERESHTEPGGLIRFVRYFWPCVEPARPLIEGWPLEAVCDHLEAVSRGEITRLLINVPPGFMKSMCANVFWPAYEWGALGMPTYRFIAASYSQSLTLRDNVRFRNVIMSPEYREMYGDVFAPSRDQFNLVKVANNQTGWKLATSVGGVGTGERSDRFVIDDGNSVKEAESEAIIASTNQWFLEVVPTRLNDAATGAIVNIQQRTGENDISGTILDKHLAYEHLIIRMEHDVRYSKVPTCIGWTDPRTEDGELAWQARFPRDVVDELKATMGPYATAGQFQQSPEPRGGGILKREYWNILPDEDEAGNPVKVPLCDYVVASLDPAFTSKEENDPSALTIWGTFDDEDGNRAVLMLYAWQKWLPLHGPTIERWPGESNSAYKARTKVNWGLVEHVADAVKRFKVDRLLIEDKASGHDVNIEMLRLYQDLCSYELVNPGRFDKVARAIRVQPIFSEGQVWRPDRNWAQLVEDECAVLPRGKHDDLADSATQALYWLRERGFLTRRSEKAAANLRAARDYKSVSQGPLYPV
jgi:phage terminase large subunit-like protein